MPDKATRQSPAELIDARIEELGDWRGETLSRIRRLITQADPDVVEEWKWRGVPTWSHDGIICTGETYKDKVKLTFAKGASLEDPAGLFNASLTGSTRRAIDLHEGDEIDERAFTDLVRAAAALNASSGSARRSRTGTTKATRKGSSKAAEPTLLSGGNPQIKKGVGDEPVQAYIEAMPGWKRDLGRRIDEIIAQNAPDARKAVKWNSPFYGTVGQGWFVSFHVFTRYVKVTFFQGAMLDPAPPGRGKDEGARWIDVHEGELDEAQLAAWVRQAAALPGWATSDILE